MGLFSPGRLGEQEPDDFCGDLRLAIQFFANLKRQLASEVERTNASQEDPNSHILITTNDPQLKESRARGENLFASHRIELRSARSGTCTVVMVISTPHVEVLLGEEPVRNSEQMMVFLAQGDTGRKAYKMDLEPLPYRLHEMEVSQIAKAIVDGVVRGHFL